MVKKINLAAKTRNADSKPKSLRRKGFVPAVIYGNQIENKIVEIRSNELLSAYEEAGESTLVDLDLDGKEKIPTIIKEVQFHPVKNKIIHADFYKVNMKEELEVEIPLEFINESKAVKELGGTLVRNLETLNVSCLPTELIDHLDVDISKLDSFEDAIYVKDLSVPGGIKILNDLEEVVANISAPAEEEEISVEVEKTEEEKKEADKKPEEKDSK
jgi:large subunit ribosomal protein L25